MKLIKLREIYKLHLNNILKQYSYFKETDLEKKEEIKKDFVKTFVAPVVRVGVSGFDTSPKTPEQALERFETQIEYEEMILELIEKLSKIDINKMSIYKLKENCDWFNKHSVIDRFCPYVIVDFDHCCEEDCESVEYDEIVRVGQILNSSGESHTAWICKSCLEKALNLFPE